MPRERKGSIINRKDGSLWARVTFVDSKGKRRDLCRRAENRTQARELIKTLLREIDDNGERAIDAAHMTFNHAADYYAERYLIEPVYKDGRKVAGQRSYRDGLMHMRVLREHFGRRSLRTISYGDIEKFKTERLQTPTKVDRARHERELKDDSNAELVSTRTLASAHRELALMRAVMRVAWREGWIPRNPFDAGKVLINVADEKKRERILTRDEEAKLFKACVAPATLTYTRCGKQVTAQINENPRGHLKPILICALDTGMRQGEMLKLRWRDVDFENGIITVVAFNTKTLRERQVAMTIRLTLEFERLFEMSPKDPDGFVFNIHDNVSKSFTTVRLLSGLPDVRFHDLRHTAATRLVQGHLPLAEVGRILGHTNPTTTYRYVNANIDTALRAAAALDAFHAETVEHAATVEMVN